VQSQPLPIRQVAPFSQSGRLGWRRALGLGIVVAIAYLLAARLSLVLLTKPEGVAVFWPAAGIASGTLIALGAGARLPVTLAVLAASTMASLLGDRNIPAAITFALCNAGEALFVASFIKYYFGPDFRLESVRSVVGFFAAAGVGSAMSGSIATTGFIFFYNADASIPTTWLNWFASDALGIILVAPLLIGIGALRDDLPSRWELAEGGLTLAALAIVTFLAFGCPRHYWYTVLPLGLLLPVLLTAHCRPAFAAAASLMLGFSVVWTTTFGMGDLGELPSLHDRTYAARATLLAISTCTLMLAALFAERKQKEVALRHTNDRLQLALDGAELGVWSLDRKSGRFESDARDREIHGRLGEGAVFTLAEARALVHPEDLACLDAAFAESIRTGDNCKVEYRLAPSLAAPGVEHWVAVEGTVLRNAAGEPVRWLGVTRDITARKRAEVKLQKSERAMRELLGALPAAIYVTDAAGFIVYFNTAAVALWGLRPELHKTRYCGSWRLYRPDGTPLSADESPMAMALKQKKPIRGTEAIAERPDGTRVPFIPFPTPLFDASGELTGAVNMLVDISERQKAEQVIAEHNMQLALAGKVGMVGSFTFDLNSGRMQVAPGYAAIHGLPEGTSETSRADWRTRVHPDDLPVLDAHLQETLAGRRSEHQCEYRILRPDADIRWIESRARICYDHEGVPQRIVGANIDVTERKKAEAAIRESETLLADALAAGQVIAFEWDTVTRKSKRSGRAAFIFEEECASGRACDAFFKHIHPEDREDFKAAIRNLSPDNPSYALTFRFCCTDGRQVWLEETAKGEFDAAGKLLRIKGLTRDITERKQAEEGLQKSERKFRELLGALPAAIYVTDAAGRITYCNPHAIALWGVRPGFGKDRVSDLCRLYHVDGTPMAPADCPTEIALKQGRVPQDLEFVLERHDGARIPIIPYPTPLCDGKGAIVGVINMIVDISKRKQAELALAERNVQLALAGKAALVGSYSYSFDADVMHVSEGYAAVHGLPEGTVETTRSAWRLRAHPEDRARVDEVQQQALRERREEYAIEYRIVRAGGEVRWIESRSFIVYGRNGRPQRVVGVNIDVTERRRNDEHQRMLAAELDHRVKNILATVSAVAAHTLDTSSSMHHFVAALDGRIRSMASTHELSSGRRWRGLPLQELVRCQLAPYATNKNTDIRGPDVLLRTEAGEAVALALHELATNAAKYGALSSRDGRVSVWWRWPVDGDGPGHLAIDWREAGGPLVQTPRRSSYGTSVITNLVPYELGGTAELAFAAEGVRWRLNIPADWIANASRPAIAERAEDRQRSEVPA
jgi:PAS domain S-box-containing protein